MCICYVNECTVYYVYYSVDVCYKNDVCWFSVCVYITVIALCVVQCKDVYYITVQCSLSQCS